MKRGGLISRMTFALIALAGAVLLLADVFFEVLPSRDAQAKRLRKHLAEGLAVQMATMLEVGDEQRIEQTLQALAGRGSEIRSLAVRRVDGLVVAQAGDHEQAWNEPRADRSVVSHISVPLMANAERWGALELSFQTDTRSWIVRWSSEPLMITLLFLATIGGTAFWLYVTRALQHLDPSTVIPDRVRLAFDVMACGVAILDRKGNILLVNHAFQRFTGEDSKATAMGKPLSRVASFADDLPDDVSIHPWFTAMHDAKPVTGYALEVRVSRTEARNMVVNCAPILDHRGASRGCLVTFDDVTELHRTNERLRETLVELAVSKEEIQHKNEELQRLATMDPLTKAMNRRAFFEGVERLHAEALQTGAPLSFMMLDIDHFKSVNDNYGHAVGDRVIVALAKSVNASVRTIDLLCRWGGEEFCVALPGVDGDTAALIAERIRASVDRDCGRSVREVPGLHVTTSIGVTTLKQASKATVSELIERADQALYAAKRGGRNRVVRFDAVRAGAAPAGSPRPKAVATS